MHRFVHALSIASLLAAAACETSGDRSGTGQCPQGEVCSAKTPKGLHFRGPDFADDWIADATIKRTAVGGSQTISIVNAQDEQDLSFPYTAKLDSASLLADAPVGALLTLHGNGAGTATLRIEDAADGKLFDRVGIEATEIASADVVAFHDEALLANDPPPSIMLGGPVQVMARLYNGLGRLVDQDLQIAISGAPTTPLTWDTVQVTPSAIGTLGVTLHAGGAQRATGSITVVDSIDSVVPGWTSFDATNPPRANQSLVACIEAVKDGAPVVGLDWTLTATGADTTASWFAVNCITFVRKTAGTVTVHGVAGGKSADFAVPVDTAAAATYAPPLDHTPGEYAASFDL